MDALSYLNQLADSFFNDELTFEQSKQQLQEFLSVHKAFLICNYLTDEEVSRAQELSEQLFLFILGKYDAVILE
ncbi:hypothetical protein [Acinetobacter bereziniae]|uniref:hypothetical protein n=1 Tax=Acinetobacter bereziniae TaxID=106648 RepID=UPI003214B459